MRHGSLFSGIGGFDLAAEWMGWENVFHCEWNEFGQKVLKYHFPNAESFNDITKTNFTKYANKIDILTGGFPCQPFSTAGKRKGTDDERYLWHEMLRGIREIKPKWVIAENVFGITNIDGGLVFQQVCLDLEAEGYEVQPFIIPAAAKNAPHRRDRCWFLAYCNSRGLERSIKVGRNCINVERESQFGNATNSDSNGQHERNSNDEINASEGRVNAQCDTKSVHNEKSVIEYTNGIGQEWRMYEDESETTIGKKFSKRNARSIGMSTWKNFPTQSPICSGDDGLPTKLDGITFSKWRNESIKGFGNAIVPQVAYELFKIIANEH